MLTSLIIASSIILAPLLYSMLSQKPEVFVLTAAIIDQLWEEHPNPTFVNDVTNVLRKHNFTVTHYKGNLDVDFFTRLAEKPYGIIILRAHSALRNDSSTVDFFTNKPYNRNDHREYQDKDWLVKGELNTTSGGSKEIFAFTLEFVKNMWQGRFPKSIVIAMGCWSLKPELKEKTGETFLHTGAVAYIGWTHEVDVLHTDNETKKLLGLLLDENETLENSVRHINPDWNFPPRKSEMAFYPLSAGTIRMSDLMAEADTSAISHGNSNNLNCIAAYITGITKSQLRKLELDFH